MRRELQANGHFGRLEANFRSLRIETSGVKRSERRAVEASARKTLQRGSRRVPEDACIRVHVRMACASACVRIPRPLVTLVSGP